MSEYLSNEHPGNDWEHIQALRAGLIGKLGLIRVAEKVLPEVFADSPYEQTLDELRDLTELTLRGGTLRLPGIQVEVSYE